MTFSKRFWIGIDPGKSGGQALIVGDELATIFLQKTPIITGDRSEYDLTGMLGYLQEIHERVCRDLTAPTLAVVIEKQQPLPAKLGGTISNYHRGFGFGIWVGLLVGLGIRYHVVAPVTWQKVMLAGIRKKKKKQASIVAAQRLWPGVDFRASPACRKPHDGMAEAALLAEYGRRKLGS